MASNTEIVVAARHCSRRDGHPGRHGYLPMSIFRPYRRRHEIPIFKLQHGSYAVATLTPSVSFQKRNVSRSSKMSITNSNITTELISDFAAAEARQRFQVSLLPVFDEIAHTFLKASHGKVHTSLQSYLDGRVASGGDRRPPSRCLAQPLRSLLHILIHGYTSALSPRRRKS